MKKIFKKSMIALMVVLFSATVAMAGNGYKSGDRDGSGPDRDRDGSCMEDLI